VTELEQSTGLIPKPTTEHGATSHKHLRLFATYSIYFLVLQLFPRLPA